MNFKNINAMLKIYISTLICNILTDIGFNVEKYKFIYNFVFKTIKILFFKR
ncbi:MAG: hypothetical protein ACSHUE_00015 [Candidatus Karelsulcia muelleri]